MLSQCIEFCKQYDNDPAIVYKSCGHQIVVLKKLEETLTSEERNNVIDPQHAKFRANKLEVLCIFSKSNPDEQLESVNNTIYKKRQLTYSVGEIISVDDYDANVDNICAQGIHYFKSVTAAYYYKLSKRNFTGTYIKYHDCGNVMSEREYVNGVKCGKWIEWYRNGNKLIECECVNGMKHGKCTTWHVDGSKQSEHEYVNDVLNGHAIEWRKNGDKYSECNYVNGKYNGKYIQWYNNEQFEEYEYVNGYKLGKHNEDGTWKIGLLRI
jgi:antitoxin component YwqK of YwqJK toxin-antitoxin module